MMILVTGGSGFIGSAVVRALIADTGHRVVNLDAMTYAAAPRALACCEADPRYVFVRADIRDGATLTRLFESYRPDAVIHLAAETHVDRSIADPARFVDVNVSGTCRLLEAARAWWDTLSGNQRERFRFLHVSTDEVFGSIAGDGRFTERSRYDPSSPYAASKAAADHLVRAWARSYGMGVIVTHGANSFGPWQHAEKLIPLLIRRGAAGDTLPLYGDGRNVRDWLYVEDHADALIRILENGTPGESYNIGGAGEHANIDIARRICALLDELRPDAPWAPHEGLISFVADRPGHDRRYALDGAALDRALGWRPCTPFDEALRHTVEWHLDHARAAPPVRLAAAG